MTSLRDLPLFPLRAVLLPGMSLPLHIFEPRYQSLLHDCQETDNRFGVVLIREGREVGGPAVPYDVGTIAEIASLSSSDDGNFHVVTSGRERFHVQSLHHDRPYLWCRAEILADSPGNPYDVLSNDVQVRALSVEYVDLLVRSMGITDERYHLSLPDDGVELSYAVAMLLRVDPSETQALLEAATIATRLASEVELLGREIAILQRMTGMHPRQQGRHRSTYSLN